MQTLPPTVAVFQILNDDRNARQHSPISGAATHPVGAVSASSLAISQVAAISRLCSLTVNGSQPSPCRSNQTAQLRLRLGKQPRTAGEPCVAFAPSDRSVARFRTRNLPDGV